MDRIVYTPIGVIRSPFKQVTGAPIQPGGAKGVRGSAELNPAMEEGLNDLDGFSHIILLYHFHRSEGFALTVTPFLDDQPRGLFATRAPRRPNAIGLSVVRLMARENNVLHIEDVDILDGTPLLDIKPYVPEFDVKQVERCGWLADKAKGATDVKADRRFA
ncbi:tRNA (N6-threonylcarbamoyladenosine(37)-N6)-methyltransferase TrmO [Desulfoferrobacter suflitae]|uniref:tRNA (N6-threonylcarbamoyladenosine(37)-N6)-methyltransferase TrmO n=1 Tax=Desulfoferrobacter suflitae TaxID=2865782 RepID=UPI002164AAB2|nr:tRNA (N6-threonylcarbamoyladenosine(37)-N6)-methyltransferase TrmO [Desulfoferrobacter suflitae]MCK8602344.1 tRNA (N6-threonylcarbamoyladenosine(37)-N6)-methyltransferase TrmO [Desulfoferrobacter suflitae]